MITPDNTNIRIEQFRWDKTREGIDKLKEIKDWLKERNIKYSFVYNPIWSTYPESVNMRNEDAVIFKLTFGL